MPSPLSGVRFGSSAVLLAAGLALFGCASKPTASPTVVLAPGAYPAAFEAAKDALREYAFELDRVDAFSGVLTTHVRGSAGFATPWVPHASSLSDAGRGFLDRERRRAAVVFEAPETVVPASTSESPESSNGEPAKQNAEGLDTMVRERAEPVDPEGVLQARVIVWVERVYRPGRRVGSTSVRLATYTSDPELREQGLEPAFARTIRVDAALESRIARAIESRLSSANRSQ